jgi:ABC-type Zn2+ transport system substrate-binding protein/surface adhesin
MNQLNECKRRIEELELNNEQLRHAAIAHVESKPTTLDNEERNKFEQEINQLKQQLTDENEQYKKKLDEIQVKYLVFLYFSFFYEYFCYLESTSITRK